MLSPSSLFKNAVHLSCFRLNAIKPAKKHEKCRIPQQSQFEKNLTVIYTFGHSIPFDMEV